MGKKKDRKLRGRQSGNVAEVETDAVWRLSDTSFYSGCVAQAVIGDGTIVCSAEEAEVCLNT